MPLGKDTATSADHSAPEDCPNCEAHHPEFDRASAAVHYAPPWSTLISRLKFQGDVALARPMGAMVAQAVAPRWAGHPRHKPDLVLPMPVSRPRLQERGYNQSWLLARHCAQALALPCRHDVLLRTRHTARLMSLSAEDRALALREAFTVPTAHTRWVRGRHVALVDDVLTTGATLDAASMALREAGASSISAWVFARTP
jgi:ComF family protein